MGVGGEKTCLGWRLAAQDSKESKALRSITSSKALWMSIGEREANCEGTRGQLWMAGGNGRREERKAKKREEAGGK